eukprot:GGOE01013233.1.p1 GENE.GGOE01013233.1~~GGOE01013233.1.p1  ORF type:complete len:252 (-),score=61.97 GGOE01013233.1:135-890(-)
MMPVLATKQPKPVGFEFDNGKHSAELEQDWNVNVTDTAVAVWLSFLRKVYAILIATALYVVVALNSPDKEFHPRNRCLVPSTSGFAITILDRLQRPCGIPAKRWQRAMEVTYGVVPQHWPFHHRLATFPAAVTAQPPPFSNALPIPCSQLGGFTPPANHNITSIALSDLFYHLLQELQFFKDAVRCTERFTFEEVSLHATRFTDTLHALRHRKVPGAKMLQSWFWTVVAPSFVYCAGTTCCPRPIVGPTVL